MESQPMLPAEKWPEIRKIKAAGNTGWRYFENLVKTMHTQLGEERTAEVLEVFMRDNARRFVVPAMKGFGLAGNDAWSLASYFKFATGDIIGYKAELSRPAPGIVSYKLFPPCLWFPDLDIPASFCRAMGCFEQEAARIVNPNLEVKHVQLMMAGDPCCEIHFIEKDKA